MKVRKGYVSNSSSSSFVIIGKQILYKDIKPGDFVYVKGKELCDGDDIFLLTPEIKEILDGFNPARWNKFEFYVSRCKGFEPRSYDEEGTILPDIEVKNGDSMIFLDKDYHSCDNAECFLESYDDYYFQDEEPSYDDGITYHCYPIIGQKLKEDEIKDFDNVWCNLGREEDGEDKLYVIRIKSKKDLDDVRRYERNFYRIDFFIEGGFKFHSGILKDKRIYWLYEHKRFNDIKDFKGKKHHGS